MTLAKYSVCNSKIEDNCVFVIVWWNCEL